MISGSSQWPMGFGSGKFDSDNAKHAKGNESNNENKKLSTPSKVDGIVAPATSHYNPENKKRPNKIDRLLKSSNASRSILTPRRNGWLGATD